MGHRMSSLPLAALCPQSPVLSAEHGAGRSAAISRAYHAHCADPLAEEVARMLERLTPEERDELGRWHKPAPFSPFEGIELSYDKAFVEETIALDVYGNVCEPDHPDVLTVGHPDLYWVFRDFDVHGGRFSTGESKYAYVPDMKRSQWTVDEGPESLQVRAYAYAVGVKHDCDVVVPGLWYLEEGRYDWGQPIRMESVEAMELWREIKAAATHEGEASRGPHCCNCYGRLHCKEFLAPALEALGDAEWSPLQSLVSAPDTMDQDSAYEAAMLIKSGKDLLKLAEDNLKEWSRRNGGVHRDGKVWAPGRKGGRESASVARVREHCSPELAEKIIVKGKDGEEFRWRKER